MFGLEKLKKMSFNHDDELFKLKQIDNLKNLRKLLVREQSISYLRTVQIIDDCLVEIDRPNVSLLVVELKISWLIREISSMLSSRMISFSDKEKEFWNQLKSSSGSRMNIR